MLDPGAPLEQRDVRVSDGVIVEVAHGLPHLGEERIDARGAIVTPGLINAHTHSNQSVQRGGAQNLPLELWIGCVLYGDGPLSVDDVYTAAALQALDLLQGGCTAVLDHAFLDVGELDEQAEAIMQAYADTGMRAAVAPVVQDLDYITTVATGMSVEVPQPEPLMTAKDAQAMIAAMDRFLGTWTSRHPLLTPFVGPAAPQRCSDDLLAGLAGLVRDHDAGVHTHLVESKSQVLATRGRYGRSVVDELDEHGLVGSHSSFAHGIWLDDAECETLARRGAVVVHNPLAAMRCGSGILPLQQLLADGPAIALGADGAGANDGQNMFEAMKLGSILHTLYGRYERWPQPAEIWAAGLRGGAAALRQPLGSVAAGAKADLVLLSDERHETGEKEHLVRSLVLSEYGSSVQTVIVGGEIVVRNGRSTRVDESPIRDRAKALMSRRRESQASRTDLYASLEPFLAAVVDKAEATDLGFTRRAKITLRAEEVRQT